MATGSEILDEMLASPLSAFVVALVIAAIAVSGKFSVTAARIFLLLAFAVAVWGLRGISWQWLVGFSLVIGGGLWLVAEWVRPEIIPSYSGTLVAPSSHIITLLSPSKDTVPRKIEIGNSGTVFVYDGDHGQPLFRLIKGGQITIESIDGKLAVSTSLFDSSGHIIAEIYRNEWKIAPVPNTWDRNYNDNTLEIKDNTGRIVLQVRLLDDRVQLQGEWCGPNGTGFGLKSAGIGAGGLMEVYGPNQHRENSVPIQPLFKYPSDNHFGELVSS